MTPKMRKRIEGWCDCGAWVNKQPHKPTCNVPALIQLCNDMLEEAAHIVDMNGGYDNYIDLAYKIRKLKSE